MLPLILIGATLFAIFGEDGQKPTKKKPNKRRKSVSPMNVFISYDHSEDLHYKNLLRAWDANSNFDFEFDQRSPNVPINSEDAGRIKSSLTKMMKDADYLLVIIGEKSHTSDWIRWEIERAKQADVKLRLAAVKIANSYTTPTGLLGTGTSFSRSFTRDGIIAALQNASADY